MYVCMDYYLECYTIALTYVEPRAFCLPLSHTHTHVHTQLVSESLATTGVEKKGIPYGHL